MEGQLERTVSTVGINGLEQPEHDPDVDGEDVEITGESAVKDGAGQCSESKNEDLSRMGILGSKAKWRRVLVVEFVNMLVKDTSMESLMSYFKKVTRY